VDHEGEPALAPRPVGLEQPRLEAGGHDHVEQVVVGEAAAAGHAGQHQRLQQRGVDGHPERLRRHVDDQVDAAGLEVGEVVVGDRGGDQGLARQVLEAEAGELVVRRHEDVAVTCGAAGQAVGDGPGHRGTRRLQP
jgi:hypothetical protein